MTVQILQGDCLEVMRTLPDGAAHCCVTSPPYWGLRDYGTAKWEGGKAECDHKKGQAVKKDSRSTLVGTTTTQNHSQESWGDICKKCGATRTDSQLGLEETPEQYVAKMVEVFAEVRRVLRDDGTLWLNLGDSYAASPGQRKATDITNSPKQQSNTASVVVGSRSSAGLKPKDLVGIPWRVAFALQADGWYLRQDIIWSKPNPMPESVKDRCTKAHEYIFLLSKSQRYYFDDAAIQEDAVCPGDLGLLRGVSGVGEVDGVAWHAPSIAKRQADGVDSRFAGKDTRNKRSVWTVTTKPYKGAHFATFPPDLIQPCILAGCPEGGTVLDPFLGSGTTAEVATKNGCNCIGIELNPDYVKLCKRRLKQRRLTA